MDIVRTVQREYGAVSSEAMDTIARSVGCKRVEVESCATFYAFLSTEKKGEVVVRLCNDIVDQMSGLAEVQQAFEQALGISAGQTSADGAFSLELVPCIGLCDQAPAALINDVPVTNLDADKARKLVAELKGGADPQALIKRLGDGNNASDLVHSMVENNIRRTGPLVFAPVEPGKAIANALALTPQEVIRDAKASRLRGRGGAGFPTGMKWDFTRNAAGPVKTVICNADEGEPGTFKDRVILTERADLVFEGMTVAGYAIGATQGILYLRGEYAYLEEFLNHVLAKRREAGLLGRSIKAHEGFDFDIRIQMGAGAYVCGEETALISSAEGLRGDPKNRPPFPAQKGYLGTPTTVNNVETFCAIARVIEEGAGWFNQIGTEGSPGSKLLSISGDCSRPGVYEVEFGLTVNQMLQMVGASDTQAVLMGGPSGQIIDPTKFDRRIEYDDLATGGAIVIFDTSRNMLAVAEYYMEFFCEESCGYCTPCRAGNELLRRKLQEILAGRGQSEDVDYLTRLGTTIKESSRCGLGQTSPNPVLTTIENFPAIYQTALKPQTSGLLNSFDLSAATGPAAAIAGHKSVHVE